MLDYIASRYDQFVEDLETIVNIDSGSGYSAGIRKIVAFFQGRFSKMGWYAQDLAFADGDVPCLEAANVDPHAPDTELDFLFLGHMDTAFPWQITSYQPAPLRCRTRCPPIRQGSKMNTRLLLAASSSSHARDA